LHIGSRVLSWSALVRSRTFAYKQAVILSTNNKKEELG
jgi:hypothetical protein